MLTALGNPAGVVAVVEESAEVRIDLYPNTPACSTITTIRSSLGDEFLPSE
jgi:hypothetical protein